MKYKKVELKPDERLIVAISERPNRIKVKQTYGNYLLFYDTSAKRLHISKLQVRDMWR